MNKTMFVVGNRSPRFEYHGIIREGTVEKVTDSVVVLKLDEDKDNKDYKAFSFNKMRPVGWATV